MKALISYSVLNNIRILTYLPLGVQVCTTIEKTLCRQQCLYKYIWLFFLEGVRRKLGVHLRYDEEGDFIISNFSKCYKTLQYFSLNF